MAPVIAANLQPYKPQCRRFVPTDRRCYTVGMKDEQKPIAAWIASVLAAKGWTAYRWAKQTGGRVNATTIKRAISDDYAGITSIRIINDLAEAAGVEMPNLADLPQGVASEAVLIEILPVVLALMGLPTPSSDDLREGASLLRSALVFLADDAATADDPSRARLAARALAKGLRPLTS
jgi:hypothetical protein